MPHSSTGLWRTNRGKVRSISPSAPVASNPRTTEDAGPGCTAIMHSKKSLSTSKATTRRTRGSNAAARTARQPPREIPTSVTSSKLNESSYCSYRPMPVADERGFLFFEHSSLPGTLECHDVPALFLKQYEDRKELLDVAVETPEHDQRPMRLLHREGPRRETQTIEGNLMADARRNAGGLAKQGD